ncbi:MAG: PaaI family thioesterase, partial [Candidatus Dormibacteraeota bacterium]|nr:PaaI family thioesterase [Candidatus Dormibacteraeota bacterium]
HVGRSLALSSCDITDPDGVLLAYATSRCIVFGSPDQAPTRSGTAPPPPTDGHGDEPSNSVDPYLREPSGTVLEQAVWNSMSGLDVLRGHIAGTLPPPPLHHLLGLTPVSAEEGSAECVMPMTGWLNTPWGWPQGGFIAVLADTALGLAVQTTVPAATAFAQIDLKVNYLRPVAPDGRLVHARATVAHRGRYLVVATAELVDESGRRVALATGSAQILGGRAASLELGRPL